MLIDFSVENFRSIRAPVTLSMIQQSPRRARQRGGNRKRPIPADEEISPSLEVPGWDFRLLRTAAIFGANASGKSNVLAALSFLLESLDPNSGPATWRTSASPFLLDEESSHKPTRFRLRLALDTGSSHVIADYAFAIEGKSVVTEKLTVTGPGTKAPTLFFDRDVRGKKVEVNEGMPAIVEQTALVLTDEALLLGHIVRVVRIPEFVALAKWLFNSTIDTASGVDSLIKTRVRSRFDTAFLARAGSLLEQLDTGVTAVLNRGDDAEKGPEFWVAHSTAGGTRTWPLREESAGTRRLFYVTGPAFDALDGPGLIGLDEFGAHLHPHMARHIVALFQRAETNPKGAQLIFNSHDVTLQADHLLRRDQIWFTSKDAIGATELVPLSDFKVRNDLALERAYLDGRFGAVPILPTIGVDDGP
ncbi:MAG: ATP-binding protein [Deltaproteobacteria bacterium]|nr:ATP-binding protein [Deltaproteobacteria bacterium]